MDRSRNGGHAGPWQAKVTARAADAAELAEVLGALGVGVEVDTGPHRQTAELTLTLPDALSARVRGSRRAGRKRCTYMRGLPEGSPFTRETPISEFLEWRGSHTPAECMAALGIGSKSSYYRALSRMRELADDEPRVRTAFPTYVARLKKAL